MIPLFKVFMASDAPSRVGRVLGSGFIGQGPVVEEFERELERVTPYPAVSMNSCTSSIHAVLMYLGVGPGDEVITTPLTCVATNAPILAVGARPVWADVDGLTGNIDPEDVQRKITRRTKAIIAVNWTGRPADYATLKEFGVPVIEDAAHGPLIADRETGDFICYSFGPIKHLTSGDGGAVVTRDPSARAVLRLLRWYGLDRTSSKDFRCAQDIQHTGMKFHMTDINAAIGLANLPSLRWIVGRHQHHASELYARIKNDLVLMAPFSPESNYWVFPLVIRSGYRDRFRAYVEEQGIAASQVHARNDKHTGYNYPNGELPGLEHYDASHINIPCGWWLAPGDLDRIIKVVNEWEP